MNYRHLAAAALVAIPVIITAQQPAAQPKPQTNIPWAYPLNPPAPPPNPAAAPPKPDPTLHTVPNSTKKLTQAQIGDGFNPPDWHPEDHPPMPDIVGHGRAPDIRACGFCHLPNAQGKPENASLAGLPAAYIEAQVTDYRNGLRQSSEPNMGPPANMLKLAKVTNEAEVKIAAEYFSKLKYKPWVKVVETKTVAKTRIIQGMHVPLEGTSEPIGERMLEMPVNTELTELRDSQSSFIAYVPIGAVKRGEALATKANAKTTQCAICHGDGLKGLGNVPFLAGRSPSYLLRQLNDFKTNARRGGYAPLMKGVVDKLTVADMIDLVAYTTSLQP